MLLPLRDITAVSLRIQICSHFSQQIISMRMRKPHTTILLVCALSFTNTIALDTPFSIDLLATPTSISSTANLTHSENLLPHTTATTVGAQNCYPSDVPVSEEAWRNCSQAIWQIPPDPSPRIFKPNEFPKHYRYGGCTVTLSLGDQDTGSWWQVEFMATHVWRTCQNLYPQTLRGASTFAGIDDRMFVRIWYEGIGNVAEAGVTARRIGDDGVEKENELSNMSEER